MSGAIVGGEATVQEEVRGSKIIINQLLVGGS